MIGILSIQRKDPAVHESYIFKVDVLFPPILHKNLMDLTNKVRTFLPVNCAVDDLDIHHHDDEQIYDLLNNPGFYSTGDYVPHQNLSSSFSLQEAAHFHMNEQQIKKEFDFNFKYNEPYGHPIAIQQQQQQHNMNNSMGYMENYANVNGYYFNDFKPQSDSLDRYSSSNESYISPLDDELFKRREFPVMDYHNPSVGSVDFDLHSEVTDLSETIEYPLPTSMPKPVFKEEKKRKYSSAKPKPKKVKIEPEDDNMDVADESVYRFVCNICNARFKVKGYLTRHTKKHQLMKAFKCPFFSPDSDGVKGVKGAKGTKCHPTGGFSRRDTFKTHLKALHFIYPPGTKSNERSTTAGRCAGCFKYFNSNLEWLESHIEKNQCSGTVEEK